MTNKNSSKMEVPQAKEAMNRFKMEVANEIGVNLTVTLLPVKLDQSAAKWFVR